MRILHALHAFPPAHTAGVEVYTDRLTRRLAREHEVAVVFTERRTATAPHSLRRTQRDGRTLYEIVDNRWYRRFEDGYDDERMREPIRRVLDELSPEVVHVQHLMGLGAALLDELAARDIPTLLTAHDHWLDCAAGGQRFHPRLGRCDVLDANRCGDCTAHQSTLALRARGFLERRRAQSAAAGDDAPGPVRASPRARRMAERIAVPRSMQARKIRRRWQRLRDATAVVDRFVAPSRYMARELERFGIAPDRITHLENGLQSDGFQRRPAWPGPARRFGYLGSIVPHKGVHVLLEAFESLPADARLTLRGSEAGDPGYARQLRHAARHPGIQFGGVLDPAGVPGWLSSLDCLVAPSIWSENAPLVVREAHLAGIPVVSSRLGGLVERLEAGGGLLVEPNSAPALLAALQRLYDEAGLASRLAASAPPVESLEAHETALVGLYEAAIAARA